MDYTNGHGRPAVSETKPLFASGGNSLRVELRGVDIVLRQLDSLADTVSQQALRQIVDRSDELEQEMRSSGWPAPSVKAHFGQDRVVMRVEAERDPLSMEFGTLNQSERPAMRRWLENLGRTS